jgi:hypothetical protein
MDPNQIAHLFANPWTAVVAVVAAAVETSPRGWLPAAVREWIGWLAVIACAPLALVVGADVAVAMLSGAGGLIGSWLLVEAVEGGRRRMRSTEVTTADDPPPLLPPPPQK